MRYSIKLLYSKRFPLFDIEPPKLSLLDVKKRYQELEKATIKDMPDVIKKELVLERDKYHNLIRDLNFSTLLNDDDSIEDCVKKFKTDELIHDRLLELYDQDIFEITNEMPHYVTNIPKVFKKFKLTPNFISDVPACDIIQFIKTNEIILVLYQHNVITIIILCKRNLKIITVLYLFTDNKSQ